MRLAPFAQHVRESFRQHIEERYPHRSERTMFRRLHPLPAIHHRELVVMMLSVLRRRIVVMVVIIRPIRQCVMHSAVRHPSMTRNNVPAGKEPAKQRQQSENSTE